MKNVKDNDYLKCMFPMYLIYQSNRLHNKQIIWFILGIQYQMDIEILKKYMWIRRKILYKCIIIIIMNKQYVNYYINQ